MKVCLDSYLEFKRTAGLPSELKELVDRSWFGWQLNREAFALAWAGKFEDIPPCSLRCSRGPLWA
eukprot:11214858-Lingulodinium_polyedra.AAC.1